MARKAESLKNIAVRSVLEGEKIVIRGAREHNLKNIDVELPRNKFVVISGLSGSGKSSLAFDTLLQKVSVIWKAFLPMRVSFWAAWISPT